MDKKLLNWYKKNCRDLPWRRTHEPYFIWLSEIMLQQTQVITVIEYYNRFVDRFNTIEALADADENEVLKFWEGLGYYSRARNLHKCAKEIVSQYEGKFPSNYQTLLKLPGIGPYTAGAIASIAFNERIPAVDGNVMRVYSRLFALDCDISDPKSRLVFNQYVMTTMPDDARHFNQAIMELGAMICTPKSPKCEICPLNQDCIAMKENNQESYPIKTKKIAKKHESVYVFFFNYKVKVMIEKRSEALLLKGLWGFPTYHIPIEGQSEASLDSNVVEAVLKDYGLSGSVKLISPGTKHVFTHLVWHMTLVGVKIETLDTIDFPRVEWVKPDDLAQFALPTAFKKNLTEAFLSGLKDLDE